MNQKMFGKTNAEWKAFGALAGLALITLCGVSWALSRWILPFNFIETAILILVIVGAVLVFARHHNHRGQTVSSMPQNDSAQPFASSSGATWQAQEDPTEEIMMPPAASVSPRPERYDPESPPVYNHLRHWKYFVKQAVPFFGVGLLAIILAAVAVFSPRPNTAYTGTAISALLLVAAVLFIVSLYGVVRANKIWTMRPIVCDPDNGMLQIYQAGLLRWMMSDSSPDPYSLDDVKLVTPSRSILERIFKRFWNSQSLILEGSAATKKNLEEDLVLTDIVDVEHLLAIQRYRESTQERMKHLASDQLAATNRQNELLEQFLRTQPQQRNDN